MMTLRRRAFHGLAAASLLGTGSMARAQERWPARPISFIVTYAPGGSADLLARALAPGMAEYLGQPVVVENRAGAGGNVGSAILARAAPDGYTIGMGATGSHAINKALFGARLPYDPEASFTPISLIQQQPNLVLLGNAVPARGVVEFVTWAKTQVGVQFGTSGVGSSPHLTGAMIGDAFGIAMEHVPYRSGGEALTALAAGQVPVVIDNIITAAQFALDGRARALAVSSAARSALLPAVPSFAESGAPGFDLVSWQALFGPAGLPAPIATRLGDALRHALRTPTVDRLLREGGAEPIGGTPEALAAFLAAEIPKWARLVRLSGAAIN
ncbi:Bug family tripartite tricarboxylate transporter substrate binding protein [Plastoroseomonas hellenica]|uniref:Bug family tripartite tricarboxylate transporter substrate binding protein n=1 Tax=Plastoroseomonas hellenica TaxID=2687306 RepID=UPI001BADC5C6|nr:tripartite tricarboxylate transporter substrate-binding protein [Plastoroseomonas hellenica]MBR0645962.1 tripartite tricarboxylate transporter substrate binding protein [Plastoroseomonas hellenica]